MEKKKQNKISKKELLEILLSQAKRIEELETELEKTKTKLESKIILIEESGTLAEAALKLNKVFETAQEAADQYLLNIKEQCKRKEQETKRKCKKLRDETDEYLKETELKVKELTEKKDKKQLAKNNLRKKSKASKRKKFK